MDITPIKTKRDYQRALKEIERLMDAKRGTREGDRLDVLVTLVEAWEAKNYPIDLPDPVEAIKYHMEQRGLKPRDLVRYIGSRNRVYEVLNRIRLCASDAVLAEAEQMLRRMIEQYCVPNLSVEEMRALARSGSAADPLRSFGEACRVELKTMHAAV